MLAENILNNPVDKETLDTTKNASSPNDQTLMSGGLKGWLGNTSGRNQSGESVNALLPEDQYPHPMSLVSGVDDLRPGLHSRKTSRGSQLAKTKSSHSVSRNRAETAGPKVIVASPNSNRFRLSAIIPLLLSTSAFSFSLVLVLAGSQVGYMADVNIVSLNTTSLGTGIINFGPTTPTTTSTGLERRETLAPATTTTTISTVTPPLFRNRETFNPLDPLGLVPALSSIIVSRASVDSSVLASAGSAIASRVPQPSISLPGPLNPTGSILSNGSNPLTGLVGGLGDLITAGLTSLLSAFAVSLGASGITQTVDDSLNEAINDLLSSVISKAGVENYYSLYALTTCQGSSSSNTSACSSFSSTANRISNLSTKVPSSLVVLGTNISSPALSKLINATASLGPAIDSLEKFLLALMILSLVNSAAAIILSFLGILLPQNRKILYANTSLASIGILTRSIDATLATTVSVTLNFIVNKFGSAVGVFATTGGVFIALIWLGFVFQSLASSYWLCVWFVEFRQISFRIRKREPGEIGDYRGVIQEIKKDFGFPKKHKEPEKHIVAV
ncbi:hypothetical protein BGZ60DRAFT_527839 [Tricladium varicosporioides]|nr:hypothetical protein BGZ60DRAFT_527839 [Hymenoscyphus varicosporioides]